MAATEDLRTNLTNGGVSYWDYKGLQVDPTLALLEKITDEGRREWARAVAKTANPEKVENALPEAKSDEEREFLETCLLQLTPEGDGGEEVEIAGVYFGVGNNAGMGCSGKSVSIYARRVLGVIYYSLEEDGEVDPNYQQSTEALSRSDVWDMVDAEAWGDGNASSSLDAEWDYDRDLESVKYLLDSVSGGSRYYPQFVDGYNREIARWFEEKVEEALAEMELRAEYEQGVESILKGCASIKRVSKKIRAGMEQLAELRDRIGCFSSEYAEGLPEGNVAAACEQMVKALDEMKAGLEVGLAKIGEAGTAFEEVLKIEPDLRYLEEQ